MSEQLDNTLIYILALAVTIIFPYLLLVGVGVLRRHQLKKPNTSVYVSETPGASCLPELHREHVTVAGDRFVDSLGRQVFFRGVNLGGCSKSPVGVRTCDAEYLTAPVSFVDRPFPLADAALHFARLRFFGLTLIRLVVPWEAIEHAGPGIYDFAYLEFLRELCRKADEFGISVVIDAHQDVWSRWTGGDGAPKWTLEMCGFAVDKIFACKSAVTHSESLNAEGEYPAMSWISNYLLFAAPTMFTLFFAGRRFAPKFMVKEEHIQDVLQRHFVEAFGEAAKILKDERNVLGFESLNEPHAGFVMPRGSRFDRFPGKMAIGYKLTPWEATQSANGKSLRAEVWKGLLQFSHYEVVNEAKVQVWEEGRECVWKQHGLWQEDEAGNFKLLDPFFFNLGKSENFQSLFLVPLWQRFADEVRKHMPDAMIFTSPAVDLSNPKIHSTDISDRIVGGRQVWAPHWYDGLTLLTRNFRSYLGFTMSSKLPIRVFKSFVFQGFVADIKAHKDAGKAVGPTMLGEIGVPWLGSPERTTKALDFSLAAAELALIDAVIIWNYSPESSWEKGDGWNREDLSIFTGNLLRMSSAVRPYPRRVAGTLRSFRFHLEKKKFEMEFISDVDTDKVKTNESEIFIPSIHFSDISIVAISDGATWKWDPSNQNFTFYHSREHLVHRLVVSSK